MVKPYQLYSYLIVILPSVECKVPMLSRIEYQRTNISFLLVGALLVSVGFFMQIVTAMQRKAIGAQDVGKHSVLWFIAFMNGNADTQGKATV